MAQHPPLPTPLPSQNFVTISPIVGGSITLPDKFFIAPADPSTKRTVPSLSFLITHPGLTKPFPPLFLPSQKPLRLLFDLGLRSRIDRYIPAQQKHLQTRTPYRLEPGIAAQLRAEGIDPVDVDVVVLSHVHYDHHGDPDDFPAAKFVVGNGSLDVLAHGLRDMGSHQHFDADLLPQERTVELPPADSTATPTESESEKEHWKYQPLGPFPAAIDLLADGSLYIINTPGHLPGHINLLARMNPHKWVCLAGDAYHDARLLSGERSVGTWEAEDGRTLCIHLDRRKAEESIGRLRVLREMDGVEVEIIAAHDEGWLERNGDGGRMFPGCL